MDMKLKRESLVNIRTMRDIVTSLDRARIQSVIKTTNLLARGGKETQPIVNAAVFAPTLLKERQRFQRRLESLGRSQVKILGARQKLANSKEKNRRIMELRLKLYKQHWLNTFPSPVRLNGSEKGDLHEKSGVTVGSMGLTAKRKPVSPRKYKKFKYGGRK